MQQASCNGSGDWCRNVLPWGSSDNLCPTIEGEQTYWATFKTANQYALYIHHSTMTNKPGNPPNPFLRYDARPCPSNYQESNFQFQVSQPGCWRVSWINPKDGVVRKSTAFTAKAGTWYPQPSPPYPHDIVVLVSKLLDTQCAG